MSDQEPISEQIKLFIDDVEVRHFTPNTKVSEVVLLLLEGDEGFLFLGDAEEPLALDIELCEIGIEKHGHVHAARCRHIEVTVDYGGKAPHSHRFPPTATVKAVRDWAVAQDWHPAIDPAERPKFALFLPDQKDALSEARRIGTCVPKGECTVTLELALRERQQG